MEINDYQRTGSELRSGGNSQKTNKLKLFKNPAISISCRLAFRKVGKL